MNKKILGIKIGTALHFLLCIVVAIAAWFLIQFTVYQPSPTDANDIAEAEEQTAYVSDFCQY